MLRVSEIFLSIQGEGLYMGAPTVFIRLAGCNLRCSWCDTRYAWEPEAGREMSVKEAVKEAVEMGALDVGRVCVTGGEPLMQRDAYSLVSRLLDMGLWVVLETNGTFPVAALPCEERLTVSMDVKCPSSGMHHKAVLDYIEDLGPTDQLKFVIADEGDYDFAVEVLSKHNPGCPVVFTPVGGVDMRWLAERILGDRLPVRVLPQLHKIIWPGEERGR